MLKFLYSSILLHHSFCRLLHSKGSYFFSYLLACVVVVFVICLISSLLSHTYPHRISRSHTKPCNARSEALYFFSVSLSLYFVPLHTLPLSLFLCMHVHWYSQIAYELDCDASNTRHWISTLLLLLCACVCECVFVCKCEYMGLRQHSLALLGFGTAQHSTFVHSVSLRYDYSMYKLNTSSTKWP